MTADQMEATRWANRGTYIDIRFERTTTGGSGSTPVTTSETTTVQMNRPITGDGGLLQGEASKANLPITGTLVSTETTTQYFKIVGRVIPISFTYVLKTTQYNYDGTGHNLPTTYTYSDPITFEVPDAADEYAFEIPVPSSNEVVTIETQTTKFPA